MTPTEIFWGLGISVASGFVVLALQKMGKSALGGYREVQKRHYTSRLSLLTTLRAGGMPVVQVAMVYSSARMLWGLAVILIGLALIASRPTETVTTIFSAKAAFQFVPMWCGGFIIGRGFGVLQNEYSDINFYWDSIAGADELECDLKNKLGRLE